MCEKKIELSAEHLIEVFENVYRANIKREGAEELLSWLKNETDFFIAPASTKYHLAVPGGLAMHSLHVFYELEKLVDLHQIDVSKESVAICGLLHDVCKTNFYSTELRWVKDSEGKWTQKATLCVDDKFPAGHGEASVMLIMRYLKLTDEEIMAINWHMGAFDDRVKGGSYSIQKAWSLYPLAFFTHVADLVASQFVEKDM